jgi:hypothetical protein
VALRKAVDERAPWVGSSGVMEDDDDGPFASLEELELNSVGGRPQDRALIGHET